MARLLDDASSEVLRVDSSPVTALPVTMAIWFKTDTTAINETMMGVFDKDVDNRMIGMRLLNGEIGAYHWWGGSFTEATVGPAVSANVWHHLVGVYRTTTDREVYLNGVSKATSTADATNDITEADRVSIGALDRLNPLGYWSGDLAEAAIWNVDIGTANIASLAKGFSPAFVRSDALVSYTKLLGSSLFDEYAGVTFSDVNVTALSAHPPIIYPTAPIIGVPSAAVVASYVPRLMTMGVG